MKRILLAVAAVLIIAVVGFYATSLLGISALSVLLVCAALVFAVLVTVTLFSQGRSLQMLRKQSRDEAGYESDISRRVSQLSAQIDVLQSATRQPDKSDVLSSRLDHMQGEMAQLRRMMIAGEKTKPHLVQTEQSADVAADTEAPDAERTESNSASGIALPVAVSNDDLRLHLQPIVTLSDRTPRFFQATMRLRLAKPDAQGESHMPQPEFVRMAETGGLMPLIDKKVLFMSVRMLQALGGDQQSTGLLCSLSRHTLSDGRVFSQIYDFLDANRRLTKSLVLELPQHGYREMKRAERDRLGQLAELGYELSLGDVADLTVDPAVIAAQGFRYLSVQAAILLHGDMDDGNGLVPAHGLAQRMAQHDITVIATQVDRENQAISVIDTDVSLARGVLFSPPRPVKRELLENSSGAGSQPSDETEVRKAS